MKESGMDKLIELLNEYEEDKIRNSKGLDVMYVWKYEGTLYYYNNYKDENVFDNVRLLIISKGYGFIQRLVENDKIAYRRCLDLWYELSVIDGIGEDVDIIKSFDDYEQLLMLLSIQDNPIEYLCGILKE